MSDNRDLYLNPEQILAGVAGALQNIVGYLRQKQEVPAEAIEQGNHWWSVLDEHVPLDESPLSYPTEGTGNILRTILYDLEHGQPVSDDTLSAVDAWEKEIADRHLSQPPPSYNGSESVATCSLARSPATYRTAVGATEWLNRGPMLYWP